MDTRGKILNAADALEAAQSLQRSGVDLKVTTGYFDPMLAEHVRRLARIRDGAGALMVVVTDPPAPILAARTRAELVAALAVVDYVVLAEGKADEDFLTSLHAVEIVRGETADERLTKDLIHHVRNRQHAR